MRQDVKADFAALDTFASSLDGALGTPDVAAYDRAISDYLDSGANDFGSGGVWNRTGLVELVMAEIGAQGRAAVEFAEWLRQWDANGDGIFDGWIDEHDMDVINAMIRDWESGFEFGALRDRASDQVDQLQEALDSGDQATIEAALAGFQGWADNPELAKELVRVLGPEGLADLYDRIDQVVGSGYLDVESLWEHGLRDLNDAVASGLSALGDEEFGGFIVEFMDQTDARAAHLALITASDHADAQVASAAALVAAEIYLPSSTGNGSALYPVVFHFAYDLDQTTPTEAILAKASGEAMAGLLASLDADTRDDMLWRWLALSADHGEDDWDAIKQLYADTVRHQVDQAVAAAGDMSTDHDWSSLLATLTAGGQYVNRDYDASLAQLVGPIIQDPAFLTTFLIEASTWGIDPRPVTDILDLSDADSDQLLSDVMAHMAGDGGFTPQRIATVLGHVLRQGDILGDDIDLGGVAKSLVQSTVGAVLKTPLTGPALGVFNALSAELARLEANHVSLAEAYGNNAEQNLLAITLYTQIHGEPPGLADWLVEHGRQDDQGALQDWYIDIGNTGRAPYDDINELATLIDESRDEQ